MEDKMKITVLEDGTIKTETDRVSMPNHASAESFLRQIATLAGGAVKRVSKSGILGRIKHTIDHALGQGHKH